jgi:hypothetical protein
VDGVAGNLEHQQEVRVEGAAHLFEVHIKKATIVRLAGCYHYVIDRIRQVTEESFDGSRIGDVEGCYAQRFDLAGGVLKALGIPAGEDQPGPFSARSSGRFQPDAGAASNHDDSLPQQFGFAPDGNGELRCS